MTIVNPEIEYLICSLTHTIKEHKYITLWRPDNAGYCWPIEYAGRYNGYESGYHSKGEDNIPFRVSNLKDWMLEEDSQGRDCIKNTPKVRQFIKDMRD